ncbi:unnamed protein product [Diamesa serratosioi]
MKGLNWSLLAALVVLLCHYTTAAPSRRIKRQDELTLDPINVDDSAIDGADREKRKLPEATFQGKNAVLGFVFGASQASAAGAGTASRIVRQGIFSGNRGQVETTTDDTPDFDRSKVSLEIPDGLFGSSFTTVTNISKIVGDLITSTSRRTAQLFWVFKPLFGNALKIEIPEPTTTTTESSS